MKLRLDCRHFNGEKPCKYNFPCSGCDYYSPMGTKVLIIKLAAMGDVLRTTALLHGLRRKYNPIHITWLVDKESVPLLELNPYVDRVLVKDLDSTLRLQVESFDILVNLDKAIPAASLATLVKAKEKFGFGLSPQGNMYPLNKEAEYSFDLGLSDELKFRKNTKTYQELSYESLGLSYHNDEYILNLSPADYQYSRDLLEAAGVSNNDLLIGLNTGCGHALETKKWTLDGFVELSEMLTNNLHAKVLLLGGPSEMPRNREIKAKARVSVIDTGGNNTLRQFAGIISCCDAIVSGDTIAMHIAIALKRPVVAIFGPTCAQEIDLYGRGQKIVEDLNCAPCYKGECEMMDCMKNISPQQIYSAVQQLIRGTPDEDRRDDSHFQREGEYRKAYQ